MNVARVDGMKIGVKKVPEWESELWSYISKGDGVICPLYGDDKARHCNEWCFNKNKEIFVKLYHIVGSDNDENELTGFRNLFEQKIPRKWVPGRVFQLTEILANKYIERAKINQPPVMTGFIRHLDISPGIEVRLLSLKANHGAVWHLKDGWVIYLNSKDKSIKQRMTLFHEVFHIIAHSSTSPVFRKRGIRNGVFNEMLADYFAHCVLMPKDWVKEKWVDGNDLKQMAEIFQATEILMWIRLKTMGLI